MSRNSGMVLGSLALGATLLVVCNREAMAQKAPPAPPTKVKQFPKPTSKPPVPKVIRLAPGQKVITPEQLRKAPTVYAFNQRGKVSASKPLSRPRQVRIPGAPRILRDLPPPASQSPTPKPVTRPQPNKGKPRK